MASSSCELGSLECQIQELYEFRDAYFATVPEELFANKNSEIETKLNDILKRLDECADGVEDKATWYFLRGKLLNIRHTYDKEVFDLLTKSIKLRPDYCDAWIELGEVYFKKNDFKLALNCFEKVLKDHPQEKKALRNASIMLRSLPCIGEEKRANILKSIELAKKAVESDLNDGISWSILGNAYLTLLFMSSRLEHNSLIKNCKSAYQKALVDKNVATKADVLYNYGSILQLEEEFEQTLHCLDKAFKYDPEWRELEERKNQLTALFGDICQKITDASSLKAKKLNSLIEKVKCDEEKLRARYANVADMCNGNVKQLHQLAEGQNDECLLMCKVLSYTSDPRNVFLCSVFHVIDSCGKNVALFIYDIVQNKGPRSGDSVVIVRPLLKRHCITFEGKQYQFEAIKVSNPMEIYVNNKRLGADSLSIPIVNVTLKSD